MLRGLYTATQGMRYESLRMDVIANNLSNASTPGYKQDRIGITSSFDTYYQQGVGLQLVADPLVELHDPPSIIYAHYQTDHSQGDLKHTGSQLDVALDGQGFFVIQHPDGNARYTRDGHFQLDANGQLITLNGWPVLGQNGPIQVASGDVQIDLQGQVISGGNLVDTIRVEVIPQRTQLARDGNNLFVAPAAGAGGLAPANTEVRQGYLEQSNVDTVREMVRMITALRNYEGYQKTIQSFDTSIGQVNEVGRA